MNDILWCLPTTKKFLRRSRHHRQSSPCCLMGSIASKAVEGELFTRFYFPCPLACRLCGFDSWFYVPFSRFGGFFAPISINRDPLVPAPNRLFTSNCTRYKFTKRPIICRMYTQYSAVEFPKYIVIFRYNFRE